MKTTHRSSEIALIVAFLIIICAPPLAQTVIEISRNQRVQFTDVFRYRPTAKNLRQFEKTLEEKSWVQSKARPLMQQTLFHTVRDTGSKGVLGLDQWLFYRPDLRYLVEPDRLEHDQGDTQWVERSNGQTQRDAAIQAIIRFSDQLKKRNICLLAVPIPGKPSVYPDKATSRAQDSWKEFRSPTQTLLEALQKAGVETVDLFKVFREARTTLETNNSALLYLAQDTHWTPLGASIAAQHVASKLKAIAWAPEPKHDFVTKPAQVKRWGDILDMMQIPGIRSSFASQTVECNQVVDPVLGPLLPSPSDRPGTYRYPGQKSSVLVLGDSFCRIYQYAEPHSLGETNASGQETKRQLPGTAGFISQLALQLHSPVDAIVSDGGASTDVRRKLSTHPEILEGKKVVIWEFVERDIPLGAAGWLDVPLPAKLD